MPTIRPKQLRREADEVAALIGQRDAFESATVKLLTFYADRVRRPPTTMTPTEAARGFGAPRPVLQALAEAFSRQLERAPGARLDTAEVLWMAGYTETRILAAELLGEAAWPEVKERVEAWVRESDDRGTIEALAVRGLRPRPGIPEAEATDQLAAWLRSGSSSLQHLALRAIEERVSQAADESLPGYLSALEGAVGRFRGARRRMLRGILEELAVRSPSETARFLMDELRRQNLDPASASFVKQLLPEFPEPQRSELGHTLSAR